MNNRRKLVIALGASALAAPFASFAQQPDKVWRVGVLLLRNRPPSLVSDRASVIPQRMRELGYVEGKNLIIDWRFADGDYQRLQHLAVDLVRLNVDVIVTASPPATSAAQKATANIPIVMLNSTDPVASGFVKSLARPGGNITGLSNMVVDLSSKLLEMLLEMAPKLSHVAVLLNPDNLSHAGILKNIQAAARRTGTTILSIDVRTSQEIDNAFSIMAQKKASAFILPRDPILNDNLRQFAQLAAKHRIPSIAHIREYPDAGGLMSYGESLVESYRRVAIFVDKILKGAKPADLPVEQPTKFELVINRKTAKALGLTIPQSLLISADRVIE